MQELNAQFVLELSYRLRERRLGDVQPLRGPTEVKLLYDRDEVAEVTEVDRESLSGQSRFRPVG
jgi:hypothetical protein